jgi:adenosylcobinamide-GDP ribazoletransferase
VKVQVKLIRVWRTALSLFTVIPVGAGDLDEGDAARAVLWMPGVGLLLGLLGGCVVASVGAIGAGAISVGAISVGASGGSAGGDPGLRRLLGAALAVALLALLTGGLHLDGLADTADGLGSRRPAPAALDIMRRSDVGPMGVATLVLTLLIQVAALAAVPNPVAAGLALVLAAVTGRVSVVLATGSPPARPGGFGALVAGRTTARGRLVSAVVLGCAIVVMGIGVGIAVGGTGSGGGAGAGGWGLVGQGLMARGLVVRGLVAAAAGLAAGSAVQRTAVRRLGGVTGDVFGAVMEISTAAVLVACALISA